MRMIEMNGRVAFGKMADEALLASHRCLPKRTLDSGFTFDHSDLRAALNDLLP